MDWKEQAACQHTDPELFFPNEQFPDPKIPQARSVCAVCPVWEPCLAYALENPLLARGIYGGLLERERKNLKRASGNPDPMVANRALAARYGFYQQPLSAAASDGTLLVQVREGFTT